MKRSVNLKWRNLWVGALLILVMVILLWASFSGGGTSIFESKKKFICYFTNVDGLVVGSPVWISGIEIGNVRSMQFVYLDSIRQIEVVCAVVTSIWPHVTNEAEVLLGSIGFLGDKYIELIPAIGRGEPIANMDVVATRDAGSIQAVYKEAERAASNAGNLVGSLDSLLAGINRGEGTLGLMATDKRLYTEMTALLGKLIGLASDLQENQERIVSSIEKSADAMERITTKIDNNSSTLGRILTDPALYDNLASTSARLDSILLKINTAEGNIGLLVNDTALYSEIRNLITRTSNLIADIEKNPRKYFKFSVF